MLMVLGKHRRLNKVRGCFSRFVQKGHLFQKLALGLEAVGIFTNKPAILRTTYLLASRYCVGTKYIHVTIWTQTEPSIHLHHLHHRQGGTGFDRVEVVRVSVVPVSTGLKRQFESARSDDPFTSHDA